MKYYINDLINNDLINKKRTSFLIKCTNLEEMVKISKHLNSIGYRDRGNLDIVNFNKYTVSSMWRSVVIEPLAKNYLGTNTTRPFEFDFKDIVFNNCTIYEEEL